MPLPFLRRYRFWRGQAGETAAEHDWGGAAPVSGAAQT